MRSKGGGIRKLNILGRNCLLGVALIRVLAHGASGIRSPELAGCNAFIVALQRTLSQAVDQRFATKADISLRKLKLILLINTLSTPASTLKQHVPWANNKNRSVSFQSIRIKCFYKIQQS